MDNSNALYYNMYRLNTTRQETQMNALFYTGVERLELRDIDIPKPASDEYLIKIEACGICGSDFEGYLGKTGRRTAPMIMGHEFAGFVAETPRGGKYPAGTKVVVYPKLFCGSCPSCISGRTNTCETAPHLGVMDCNGAMTEYICVRQDYLVPYDPSLKPSVAAMAEPIAVAYNAVSKLKDQIPGASHILVVGSGTIGLLVVMALKLFGAKHIIVSDLCDCRLALAGDVGADDVINPGKENFTSMISRFTNGAKCDLSFEAVGINGSAVSSLDALHSSGAAVWIGNAQKMIEINMQTIVTTELTIRGSYAFTISDFVESVSLLSREKVDPRHIITDTFPLERGAEAFNRLKNNSDGSALKVMLSC